MQAWLHTYHVPTPQPWPRVGLLRQALVLSVHSVPADVASIATLGFDGAAPPLDLHALAATGLEHSPLKVVSSVRPTGKLECACPCL